ncbi:MAG: T9SS type A sorting domain-containing protein [Taibaiella sp.]|nr:T9SS type A sorting domain-containing protein [Taibaiella sp.]
MKRKIVLFTAIAGICSLTLSSYHNGMKPFAGTGTASSNRTGSQIPGGGYFPQHDCSTGGIGCHQPITPDLGVVTYLQDVSTGAIVPVDSGYVIGHPYKIVIIGVYTPTTGGPATLTKFGFQLGLTQWGAATDRFGSFDSLDVASLTLPANTRSFKASGANVIEQLNTIDATATPNNFKIAVPWTPKSGQDSIGIFGVMCAVDGLGSSAMDYTGIPLTPPGKQTGGLIIGRNTTAVNNVFKNASFSTYPNPVSSALNIEMSNLATGSYTLNAYDLTGRRVVAQSILVNSSSYKVQLNTASWMPGVYQVQLQKDGDMHNISIVKQ